MKKRGLLYAVLLVCICLGTWGIKAATIPELTRHATDYMDMIQKHLQWLQSKNQEEAEMFCVNVNGRFAHTVWLLHERNAQLELLDFESICKLFSNTASNGLLMLYEELNFFNFDLVRELCKKMTVAGPGVTTFVKNMAQAYLATCGMVGMVWGAIAKAYPEETHVLTLYDIGCAQRFRAIKKYLRKIVKAADKSREQLIRCIQESEEVIPRTVPETTDRLCGYFLQYPAFLPAYRQLLERMLHDSRLPREAIDAVKTAIINYDQLIAAFWEGRKEAAESLGYVSSEKHDGFLRVYYHSPFGYSIRL
ncbi:hypothetical protein FJ365_03470 [Candidatus Dependentiae bacterium]|nr:hypothetical protein [Candidatus Dependentiae bacterium]